MHYLRSISRIPLRPVALSVTSVRSMSTGIAGGSMGKAWQDKEHAAETAYFNKKDAETLAELAKKLHLHTTPDETTMTSAKAEIAAICQKHSVQASEALIEDVSFPPQPLPRSSYFHILDTGD